jgi:hypothetical protein
MKRLLRAAGYARSYNANSKALERNSDGTNLASPSITYTDRHGRTRIKLENMRRGEVVDLPEFDLTYAHARRRQELPPPESLLSAATVPDVAYRSTGVFEFSIGRRAYIDIDPSALHKRIGLLPLAHEIGHYQEVPLLDAIVGVALDLDSVDLGQQKAVDAYQPAVEALAAYNRRHPDFADAYATAAQGSSGTGLPPYAYVPENNYRPLLEQQHPEAATIISAAAEASAWRYAFQMVNEDRIHPGYSQAAMQQVARDCIATYDQTGETDLYGQTYEYMLKSP